MHAFRPSGHVVIIVRLSIPRDLSQVREGERVRGMERVQMIVVMVVITQLVVVNFDLPLPSPSNQ